MRDLEKTGMPLDGKQPLKCGPWCYCFVPVACPGCGRELGGYCTMCGESAPVGDECETWECFFTIDEIERYERWADGVGF